MLDAGIMDDNEIDDTEAAVTANIVESFSG
jgi:hypothetical protein